MQSINGFDSDRNLPHKNMYFTFVTGKKGELSELMKFAYEVRFTKQMDILIVILESFYLKYNFSRRKIQTIYNWKTSMSLKSRTARKFF